MPHTTKNNNSGHVECTLSDYVAFAQCFDFVLQKDIPVFCRNVSLLFFLVSGAREANTDWINWLMSHLVTDALRVNLFRLEFQVLWHIPETAVELINCENSCKRNEWHKLDPCESKMLTILAFVSALLINMYQRKLRWEAFHVFWDTK